MFDFQLFSQIHELLIIFQSKIKKIRKSNIAVFTILNKDEMTTAGSR